MTDSYTPARHEGDSVQRRRVRGDYFKVKQVVDQLSEMGLFLGQTAMMSDEQGSFAVVTYYDPEIVREAPRPRSTAVAIARPAAVAVARPRSARPWWAIPAGILVVVGLFVALGFWVASQVVKMSSIQLGSGVVGFAFCLILAGLAVKALGGKKSSSSHDGMGLHWTPCDK